MVSASGPVGDAVIYVRISQDREGAGLGVARQEQDCRELAARLRRRVVDVFVDNDVSAYAKTRKPKPRKDYGRMVEMLRTDRRTPPLAILAWHSDRIHRTVRELEDFIDLCHSGDHPVETVRSGKYDLSTPSGRMQARQMCVFARFEGEHKAERLERAYQQQAEEGRPHGGPRPFGFEPDGATVREDEAAWITWAFNHVVTGGAVDHVVQRFNENGVKPPRAACWTPPSVGRMLRRPRYAGLREHKGAIIGKAVWPEIVDRPTFEAVQAILANPSRVMNTGGSRPKLLISGRCYCGRDGCGARMVSHPMGNGTPTQTCVTRAPYFGCGRMRVVAGPVNELVEKYVIGRFSDPKVYAELAAREAAHGDETRGIIEAIEDDEKRLRVLSAQLDDEDEDEIPEVAASIRRVRERIRGNRDALADRVSASALRGIDPATIATRWYAPDFGLDRQRALMDLVVERVVIYPATVRGANRFDPRRVDIVPVRKSGGYTDPRRKPVARADG